MCDFGLSRILTKHRLFTHTLGVGTPLFMGPEQLKGDLYNEKCDIWALGCLIYELIVLSPPLGEGVDDQAILDAQIIEGTFEPIPREHYSEELQRIIEKMIVVDAATRITVKQCLEEPRVQPYVRAHIVQCQERSSISVSAKSGDTLPPLLLKDLEGQPSTSNGQAPLGTSISSSALPPSPLPSCPPSPPSHSPSAQLPPHLDYWRRLAKGSNFKIPIEHPPC